MKPKTEPKQDMTSHTPQGKFDPTTSRTRDIKCFKCQGRGHISRECPNKRVMVITPQGEFVSEDEEEDEDDDDMPPLEDAYEGECAVDGESLVARRALSVQAKEEINQREN